MCKNRFEIVEGPTISTCADKPSCCDRGDTNLRPSNDFICDSPMNTWTPPLNTSPCKRMATPRNTSQIRTSFYQKLGLLSPYHSTTTSYHCTLAGLSADKFLATKQEDPSTQRLPHKKHRRQSSLRTKKDPRLAAWNVSFRLEAIAVKEIPSHTEYDFDTWLRMWDMPETVKKERRRNALEFAADDCDWRQATEEEEMFLAKDGSHVHPATYWNDCWYQRPNKRETRRKRPSRLSPLLLEMEMEPPCECLTKDGCKGTSAAA
jgi:hypothetical protein